MNGRVLFEMSSDMSCTGSKDAEGNNLKDNPSDLGDRRRLNSPSDQQEDNLTATGTTDRCVGANLLPVPVMAGKRFTGIYQTGNYTSLKVL